MVPIHISTDKQRLKIMNQDASPTEDSELDLTGLICPEPVMLLHRHVKNCKEGEILKVLATDPATQRDVPKFCEFLNHRLVKHSESLDDNGKKLYIYWLKVGR